MIVTYEEFMNMTPDALFTNLTGDVLYNAVQRNDTRTIDAVLSCFDADARRELCVGLACLRAMGDTEYRSSLRSAMSSVLYKEMKGR